MTKIYVCSICKKPCMAIVEDDAQPPFKCLYDIDSMPNWHLLELDECADDIPVFTEE